MRPIDTIAISVFALGASCKGMGSNVVTDEQVARMSMEQRQQILKVEKQIGVEESNVSGARAGVRDAETFVSSVDKELSAANTRLKAAKEVGELQQRGSQLSGSEVGRSLNEEQAAVEAARAKKDYADRLLALRQTELNKAQTDLNRVQKQVAVTKIRLAFQNGDVSRDDVQRVETELNDAQVEANRTELEVKTLTTEVDNLKQVWTAKQGETNPSQSALPRLQGPNAPATIGASEPRTSNRSQ